MKPTTVTFTRTHAAAHRHARVHALTHSRARALALAVLAGAAAAAGGCNRDRPGVFNQKLQLLPPVPLSSSLVFVETSTPTAVVVDVASESFDTHRVPLGPAPTLALRRLGHEEILVLSRGERGGPGVPPVPATLAAVTAASGTPTRSYTLGSRFNAVAQSADGRWALAYFRKDAGLDGVLFNPNEIAVIDLDAPPSDANPAARTVRSFGGVPNDVVFSPSLMLPDGPRTLAVVLSDTYVTLVDLDHASAPEVRPEITVPLTLPEDTRLVRPAQVVFDAADPTVYVRCAAADDVYALRLAEVPVSERQPGGNDFRPSLSQLAAGQQPYDMALYDAKGGRRLLVVSSASRDASVIDVRTSRVTRIALDAPYQRIVLFTGTAPGETEARPRALLVGGQGGPASVAFVDLDNLEDKLGRNVESRPVSAPIAALVPRLDKDVVLALHAGAAGGAGVSVIDLQRRTAAPILAEVPLDRASYGANAARLWVAPAQGARLGYLDLDSYQPGEVRLDAAITDVLPLDGPGGGAGLVAVLHPGAGGSLTVLDAASPARETARSVRGFLFTGLLGWRDP